MNGVGCFESGKWKWLIKSVKCFIQYLTSKPIQDLGQKLAIKSFKSIVNPSCSTSNPILAFKNRIEFLHSVLDTLNKNPPFKPSNQTQLPFNTSNQNPQVGTRRGAGLSDGLESKPFIFFLFLFFPLIPPSSSLFPLPSSPFPLPPLPPLPPSFLPSPYLPISSPYIVSLYLSISPYTFFFFFPSSPSSSTPRVL